VAEQTFLQPDGAADSPLPDYPGRIKFPLVMTLVMHKAWQRFVNARAERDPEANAWGRVCRRRIDAADNAPIVSV
jgi:hypothetical protein